jgi:hypothetical protein
VADMIQGVPVRSFPMHRSRVRRFTCHPRQLGLTTGALPLLLSSAGLSYSQVGLFALCSYPFAAKLLWSPLVYAKFSKKLGRRKSWIVPLQVALAFLILHLSMHVDACLSDVRACSRRRDVYVDAVLSRARTCTCSRRHSRTSLSSPPCKVRVLDMISFTPLTFALQTSRSMVCRGRS